METDSKPSPPIISKGDRAFAKFLMPSKALYWFDWAYKGRSYGAAFLLAPLPIKAHEDSRLE
jgi:hypothetical protein